MTRYYTDGKVEEEDGGTLPRSRGKRVKNRHEDNIGMNDVDGMAEKSNTMGCREKEKRKKSKKSQTPQEIHVCKKNLQR